MPDSFEVNSSTGNYPVTVGTDLLARAIADNPDAIFVIDQNLVNRLPATVTKRIVIEAIEANKSLEYAPHVIKELRRHNADRTSHLVAIGGGIIQDVTTFAASIFMRGIPWTYMPTTVLSMVDSCIGGKSSINAAGFKNLVGNFYPPGEVIIDVSFIETLNAEMIVGGLYEAAKITYASGDTNFQTYLADKPGYPLSQQAAQRIILHSLLTKKWFIEIDEFDQKERLLLNYGHTFGHALEAGTDFGVSHGIGVGLGMLIATAYAKQQNLLNADGLARSEQLAAHVKAMLGPRAKNVLAQPPFIDLGIVIEKFDHDKKHKPAAYRIIVPQGDGTLELISLPKTNESRRHFVAAYAAAFDEIPWAYGLPDAKDLAS